MRSELPLILMRVVRESTLPRFPFDSTLARPPISLFATVFSSSNFRMADRASPQRGYFAVPNSSSALLSPSSPNTPHSPFRSTPSESAHSINRPSSLTTSLSEKYHLTADPTEWGADITRPEPDDALHDPRRDDKSHNVFTQRGLWNVGCIAVLAVLLVALFLGYPVTYHFTHNDSATTTSALVNASGQVASIGNFGLIDLNTPKEFYKIASYYDPSKEMQLVFSDEFEEEGRTFYPGDDPYWEAVDMHYWSTGDLEWYDPAAITTRGGALEINLTHFDDISLNHNLEYRSGMMSTWNKFCFTGGLILANVMLPGTTNVFGLWPAIWTMGNLGRAGYGATLEGMWPYSYDACDAGTMPNQTLNGGPPAALNTGKDGTELSFLPGQRLSRCVCPGESHPGPVHEDGTYVGRSAPEIDVFEAQIGGPDGAHVGQVSQSAQWAPFNAGYIWDNSSANVQIPDLTVSSQNTYSGSIYQQATSVLTTTNQNCYQLKKQCYAVQGFEYIPGYDQAYVTWISDNKVSWTMRAAAAGADTAAEISARPITQEPLYILVNLGFSHSFSWIDFDKLIFPATMRVDWIRVYQPQDKINIGCDPAERPTAAYINTYLEAYTNPNLTTWHDDYKQPNSVFVLNCCLVIIICLERQQLIMMSVGTLSSSTTMPYPFALTDRPSGDWKDQFDNRAIEMSVSHNMFIRGINAIYAQAERVTKAQVKSFAFFCISFIEMVHHHHHIEETLLFPFFETKFGEGSLQQNVQQHTTFMGGLQDLQTYFKAVHDGSEAYNGVTVIEKLNSFSDELVRHLVDEIPTLESSKMRAAFTEKELTDLDAALGKRILAEVSLVTSLPVALVCHEKSSAPYFPPLPTPILWVAKYGLYRLHSDAWAFGPCDVHGILKPGFGNDA
ncbi:GH16 domain-containing protein [Mycena indigotica]|uniref:GH16 domain-containing protein n=1 Tax=Mycena indigotica TaxID=2126181 RepID=A0A8H6W3L1_9AGAR|nr:GH16 domain-containing protein [Mycena indigotica]KAF7303707.1 GH16 domain-containing protein [Mycena indigotica]